MPKKEVSERVIQMKANFMRLHNEGKSIKEIAKAYSLCNWSVYHHLQKIADDNGVTRDSLLSVVQKPKQVKNVTCNTQHSHVDIEEIRTCTSDILKNIENIVSILDTILERND